MTIIIGIDPGSRRTGYGVVQVQGNQTFHLTSGCFDVSTSETPDRLQKIFLGIQEIIALFKPQEAAIEQIFMHQNPNSALKLGQARGAAIVALNMPLAEYSARQVKQAVVGYGAAKKEQVQHMVKTLLSLKDALQADAADALAIALCHAHSRTRQLLVRQTKRSSWRDYQPG